MENEEFPGTDLKSQNVSQSVGIEVPRELHFPLYLVQYIVLYEFE
jgi:hypothetical protein